MTDIVTRVVGAMVRYNPPRMAATLPHANPGSNGQSIGMEKTVLDLT